MYERYLFEDLFWEYKSNICRCVLHDKVNLLIEAHPSDFLETIRWLDI